MTQEERKEALHKVKEGKPFATGYQLLYRGVLRLFEVYEISLDNLIYNQYNGRIGSVVKSYEKQSHQLNPEDPNDARLIEDFLWDSKAKACENTLESLKKTGQIKFGIVTSDGVIIDGNRRASIMNRIRRSNDYAQEEKDRCQFFKAVILPEEATKRDIMQLETSFQMGEDEKVDYNPIEKYLKCRDLVDEGFTTDEIANFMATTKKEVEQNLEILELMDQYLAYNNYDGIYTMAEGHEDSFQKLNLALKQYKGGVASMWDFKPEDLNNLMAVSFDYIRLNLPQNDIRDLFRKPSHNNNSVFGSKDRWERFWNNHMEIINKYEEHSIDEYTKNASGKDISECLRARDNDWKKQIASDLTKSFKQAQDEVDSQLNANAPIMLLAKAQNALDSIKCDSEGFKAHSKSIIDALKAIINKSNSLMSKLGN